MKEFAADLIPSHFLYVMSHLIQKNWGSQTNHRKEQSVNTVISLVRLVRPDSISKFLPKVIVAIDAALCSSSARVRAAGVKLTNEICSRLPLTALAGNVAALVIALYPIVESFCSDQESDLNVNILKTQNNKPDDGAKRIKKETIENKFSDLKQCLWFEGPDTFLPACENDPKLPKVWSDHHYFNVVYF